MYFKKSLPLVLAAVAVFMAHAEHRNRAMVCSFGRSTAVQDGKVSPGEYSAAFSFTFAVDCQDRLGMVLEENPMRTWYAWDDANIYIAARYATPSPDETVRVEALFSASGNKSARDVVRFAFDGNGNTPAGATGKLLREEGHVTLEAAIPWKSIGASCRPGVPVFLNIARISSKAGSSPVVGATARGPVDDASVFLSFMPSENVSRWSYGPFGQTMKTGRVSPSLEAVAAMDGEMYSDIVASVRLPPRFFWRKRVKCRKGEKIALSEDAPAFPTGRYMITLKDADGTRIVDASYPYHDDTKVAYVGFLTDPKTKELQLVTANWLSAGEKCLAHLVFKDYETEKKVVWEADVPIKAKRGTFEQNLDITKLPPGRYLVEWSFLDGCGKKLDSGIGYYAKPDGKAPWDDCTAGMEDTVPSPWTAPVFGDDNVCVWGRSMRLGGGGLLSSAVSQGKELLAEPVRLVLGGKPLEFDVKRIEKRNSSARECYF